MSRKKTFIKGTFLLTSAGIISRCIGFLYRIFLSQTFGAEGLGLYQLIFPIFALGYALTTSGIETAISRNVSAKIACGRQKEAKEFFLVSASFSLLLSFIVVYLLQHHAAFISISILGDTRTYELLLILSYAFPFASIHSCIIGYYLGQKRTEIPALIQLIEQVTRVLSIVALYYYFTTNDISCSIALAVVGLVIGEIAATLFTLIYIFRSKPLLQPIKITPTAYLLHLRELLPIATPLTANRVTLNVLRGIEALSIPLKLQAHGLTANDALSTYGILTGMALPCILFPTAITSSVSALLLPTIAEIQALNNKKEIKLVVQNTIKYCTLMGFACFISFFMFSDFIGTFIFQNPEVTSFLKVLAWLCPFLYLNITLLSIMNGLGKPSVTFLLNSGSLLLRIGFIYVLVPTFGIYGYLWGLLVSEVFVTCGCFLTFQKLDII